jgi:transposase
MKINQIIAIDTGKFNLQVHLYRGDKGRSFKNTTSGITQLLQWVAKHNPIAAQESIYLIEHTGIYCHELTQRLAKEGITFAMASGLAIHRSSGIVRGKSDPIDARAIAWYGYRFKEELTPCILADESLMNLKHLLSLRNRMVKQRAGYKATLKEQQRMLNLKEDHPLVVAQQNTIAFLSQQIKTIEKQCRKIIKEHQTLSQQYKWITSIKGVGPQTAMALMATTQAFTKFKTWRKFACYCGTAPFPYQSGSSIKGKTKVSHLANKNMKKLLNMCAISAIQHDKELKAYYQRKLEQGKHKMAVINAVRNKIIARVFAVVSRQSPFVDTHKFAA